ncbi:hypothetical protein SAMN04488527_101475 [Aliiroseovarius crassostreae]|uniref:Lipoprotein n=1 Tax=Aliiroseovarius crassostreae TaxID=154981 RepID=A0A0P7JSR2_9RHOB|nr:hypothetical protein [Aliiroseovarius crassostreae]KPN64444.1 hypothetical protein AKJ29_17690 [Aliiroseovarius crassostreae]SFU35080.1 hypothetical protein SAMN04488527_101475 [Aliiroseovarius crassostreae]
MNLSRATLTPFRATVMAGMLLALGGCDLHRESNLRATLSAWFQLGDTLGFESGPRCTAAVFRVRTNEVGPDLPMGESPSDAQGIYGLVGRAAIQMEGVSPHQLTDTMLLANDGWFGKHALGAAAQVGPCLNDQIEPGFYAAMTRPGAVLAYSAELDGVMVLDPVERKLFFAAGDTY